jgi:predicted O-methyltransferase YrrM
VVPLFARWHWVRFDLNSEEEPVGSSARARFQALAPSLDKNTLNALADMYGGKALLGTESENPIALDEATRISPEQGATLRQLMMDNSASRSLEVGFAYGFSTLWMLDALRKPYMSP